MAKVTGPLFSITASGQIAKSLVYMTWKGIADVRKYVIPANPKTALQTIQRAILHAAVDLWHSTVWIAADKTAWNLLASIQAAVMSGFNAFVMLYVDTIVAAKTFYTMFNFAATPAATTCSVVIGTTLPNAVEAYLYYGISKTALNTANFAASNGTTITFALTGLTASTKYYCKVYPKDATKFTYSGIYTFTTTA
jgi:hypothetical protein